MALMNVFDIAGTALSAQSLRLNLVSSNLANADAVSSSTERTYRARHPVFELPRAADWAETDTAAVGVRVAGVVESQAPLRKEFRPDHPKADADGYIFRPNVNVVEELADMISASRSFQTNVQVMDVSRQMILRVLSLGQ